MLDSSSGSFRIFRFLGIEVRLHWLWFVLLYFEMQYRQHYDGYWWNLAEFLSLFGLVLMHEYGHALACRSVGGKAQRIVLWPLGGIAYVEPPRRPGAVLWSIAAGPLVNVLLVPVTIGIFALAFGFLGVEQALKLDQWTDFQHYAVSLLWINLILLVFNLLPIYPLDGGQIVWSLLWFVIGQARGLQVAATIGLVAAAGGGVLALVSQNWWLVIMAVFVGLQAWRGYRISKILIQVEQQELLNTNPWQTPAPPSQDSPINRP